MKLGQWGEDLVMKDYISRGYHILERNWHTRYGEIDIIARNEDCLVFVEVKTRKNQKYGEGFESVDWQKQEKLSITAELYLVANPTEGAVRFDVASVYAPRGIETKEPILKYIEGAF